VKTLDIDTVGDLLIQAGREIIMPRFPPAGGG
jgi:hypothetical protein